MYTSGMMRERIKIILPPAIVDGEYGRTTSGAGTEIYRWAAVDWTRGTKAMREGALDAYDTIMVRMYYDSQINRNCKIEYEGNTYNIISFHSDKHENTIQITATELQS